MGHGGDADLALAGIGKIRGVVDSTYGFADVLKAYEKMMSGRAAGKIIVKVEE